MPARRSFPWLLLVLLGAAAVRVAFALEKGLVLDEFHTYFHSTREGWQAFRATLLRDNHPPLSFLVIGGGMRAFGDDELVLRLPAILCGLLELVLVARLARPLGRRRAALAAALVALSTLHLDWSTQARMYAFLSLAVTGLTVALVEHLEGAPRRRRWMVLWVVFGFHSHYYTAHYSVVLAGGVLALAIADRALWPRVRALVPAGVLALALCAPWLLTGFREQLGHALPPGGDDVGLVPLLQALGHLFYLNVFLAEGGRPAMLLGAAAMLGLAAWGTTRGLREDPRRTCLLVVSAVGVPILATVLALAWSRAGFTWNYVLPSCAPMAVLAARGVGSGPLATARRLAAGYALATMGWLVGLHLASDGTEDFPGAVRRILELHRPGDAVVSVEYQPPFFAQGLPWDYYAPRLAEDPPERVPMRGYDVGDRRPLARADRVLVLVSKLPADRGVRKWLERERELVRDESFGFGRRVLVYGR